MTHLVRRTPSYPQLRTPVCAFGPRSADCEGRRFCGNDEPSLAELLGDPMMARLIASDGVAHEDLTSLVDSVRSRLGA